MALQKLTFNSRRRNGEPLPKNFDKIVPRAKDRMRLGLE